MASPNAVIRTHTKNKAPHARQPASWRRRQEVFQRHCRLLEAMPTGRRKAAVEKWRQEGLDAQVIEWLFDYLQQRPTSQFVSPHAPPQLVYHQGQSINGRYVLNEKIGEGGMGTVYLARDPVLDNRLVALKLVKIPSNSPPQYWSAAFSHLGDEFRSAGHLKCPYIAEIYDAGAYLDPATQLEVPFYVMEYVAGGRPLAEWIPRRESFSLRQRLEVFHRICIAVGEAHRKKLVHRDLKPANILLDGKHRPCVLDFGLAFLLDRANPNLSLGRRFAVGTPLYMSPEQVDPAFGPIGFAADIHALGLILFELITGGDLPYCLPPSATRQQLFDAITSQEPKLDRIEPPALREILAKSLVKHAQQRDFDILEMEQAIDGCLRRHFPAPSITSGRQNLPYPSLGALFKGREAFLENLRQSLHSSPQFAAALTAAQTTIHGLGGVGKTRLAVEYGWRFQNDYSAVLFVRADSPQNLRRNLAELASLLDLPEKNITEEAAQFQATLRWLEDPHHAGWLLIFDNVDSPQAAQEVENLLSRLQQGHLLITSRISQWSAAIANLPLDVLDEQSFGNQHPNVARDLNNLAQLLKATNRLGEAEPLMRRALAIDEQSFGNEHPNVAIRLSNLASLLQATNRLGEAEPLMRRALGVFTDSLGEDHPHTQIVAANYQALLDGFSNNS